MMATRYKKTSSHWDVGNICAPDLVRPVDHCIAQQIWPNLVVRMLFAGVGCLINWHQPHETHQTARTVTTALMVLTFHETGHLARPIPRRVQELFINYFHEAQVLGALADRLIIKS